MDRAVGAEDDRGVDITQVRAQLRLSVPERVQVMVEAANRLLAVQEAADRPKDRAALPYLESLLDEI